MVKKLKKQKAEQPDKKQIRPKTKFDFVGHITYPDLPALHDLLLNCKNKCVDRVEFNGEVVYQQYLDTDFTEYLRSIGYTVTRMEVPATSVHSSNSTLTIPCENTGCPFFKEKYHHKNCKIKVKTMVEVIIKPRKTVKGFSQILVTYKARDLRETTVKSDCIMKYIFEQTGAIGEADTYGKMELC